MELPQNINVPTVLPFEPNHQLDFDEHIEPSYELAESLEIQRVIERNYVDLEVRYNRYAIARNQYYLGDNSEYSENALWVSEADYRFSRMAGPGENVAHRPGAEQLLTRIVFGEIVEALHNDIPGNDKKHVNFYQITQEAEEPFAVPYTFDEGEY